MPFIWLAITGIKLQSFTKIKLIRDATSGKEIEKLTGEHKGKESRGPPASALGIHPTPEEIEDENADERKH